MKTAMKYLFPHTFSIASTRVSLGRIRTSEAASAVSGTHGSPGFGRETLLIPADPQTSHRSITAPRQSVAPGSTREGRARQYKRGGRGRESGYGSRVSPRTEQPSNSPSASHRPATKSPLGKRRSGAKTRMGLSAEKREEPFAFLRLFPLAPADRGHVRNRSVPGTGTLPDAGGAGGGGHAPRLPRPRDGQGGVYAYRAPRGDCDHRDSRLDAAAGVESGA